MTRVQESLGIYANNDVRILSLGYLLGYFHYLNFHCVVFDAFAIAVIKVVVVIAVLIIVVADRRAVRPLIN